MTYDLETIEKILINLSNPWGVSGTKITPSDWDFLKKSHTIISELVEELKKANNTIESLKEDISKLEDQWERSF